MTAATETTLSIGEISARTGLSTHTLRFYEQEGLFIAPVRRNAAGRRVFTEQDVDWLRLCAKLRSTGLALPDIRRYAELVRQGPGNEAERFEILRRHEAKPPFVRDNSKDFSAERTVLFAIPQRFL